jgi:hypothetical protein
VLAAILTLLVAAPVLRAPSQRVFGMEIVGRHQDPFAEMELFGLPISMAVYTQPVTDITGALFARISGAVAAYNWLVLLSFPLSAATAYLLARYLSLSRPGATVAALAYAFSPFHLAQAAYHPHIAQTQWIPLYFLALWRCLDRPSRAAVGFLGVTMLTVTLSNFYGGLIAGVMTPVALAAYWSAETGLRETRSRRLLTVAGSLVLFAALGWSYFVYAARAPLVNPAAFAFPRDDLFLYSAKWWSYLVPPVAHPLLGPSAREAWTAAGVREGLLEQQVSLGWGIVALGLIATVRWLIPITNLPSPASLPRVPAFIIVALAALLCSLSPERAIGAFTFVRPSALLYEMVPMFRAYARFGVVVQLMAALLAGVGVDYLRRSGSWRARIACIALVILAAGEYTVAPSAMWRDVLPTAAQRWVTQQPANVKALDCMPLTQESESVQWLTSARVMLLANWLDDCTEPNFARKLAANGYTHLIVHRDTDAGRWFADHAPLDGFSIAAQFDDDEDAFAVNVPPPAIYTATMTGFSPREQDAEWVWRWMGTTAAWTVINTGTQPVVATLDLEMSAFLCPRDMDVMLDGRAVQTLSVGPARRVYHIDAFTVPPGYHSLVFHPAESPAVADDAIHNGDRRPLSFALGTWRWSVDEGHR